MSAWLVHALVTTLLWGVWAFFMTFIPTLGFFLAVVPPALLALVTHGWQLTLVVFVGFLVIYIVTGGLRSGRFVGRRLNLSPLVILLSSVVGSIFGIGQMFAAKRGWEWNFKFHFGPYLAIAGIVAMFWGRQIVGWYLR